MISVFLSAVLFYPVGVFAQEPASEGLEATDSYELFWPIVAGKTLGDPLYFVKTLKENIRGILILGKAQKTEYSLFLTTKRVVEAEKLMLQGSEDLASKTLDKAILQVDHARKYSAEAGGTISLKSDEINNQLDNLERFLPLLASNYSPSSDKINSLLEQIEDLNRKI